MLQLDRVVGAFNCNIPPDPEECCSQHPKLRNGRLGVLKLQWKRRTAHKEEMIQVDQDAAVYEPPMLVEVGDFAELTRGSGFDALDSVDYYAGLT
jgi:hypothetical protein